MSDGLSFTTNRIKFQRFDMHGGSCHKTLIVKRNCKKIATSAPKTAMKVGQHILDKSELHLHTFTSACIAHGCKLMCVVLPKERSFVFVPWNATVPQRGPHSGIPSILGLGHSFLVYVLC
jgi:hypothetical protein